MKISETWLREWVNPPITTEQLAAQLTMAGLEVDSVAPVAGQFTHVVVAKVLHTAPHPQADKLTICQVDCNAEKLLQIVCGASNVRTGLIVALARTGATLPNGMTIKETKLRGELSQGMLCSASELSLHDSSEGILELPDDAPLGVDLREYMALDDAVLDLDLTPNRADCFSILGVAREVATLNECSLREPKRSNHQPTQDETVPVYLDEPTACSHYYGRVICDINPHATTPLWLLERLRRSGIRPIHPVVDVTNYVMIELGQPMHAFNRHALGDAIHVRFSQKSETLTLLDDQSVTLQEKTLIIADNNKPLAIAGIMGGAESAVQADTTDIFIESAFFNPRHIAGVARRYNLCTESSQRFERGVDPAIQQLALDYATDLLISIVGGRIGPIISAQAAGEQLSKIILSFNPEQVQNLTGVVISEQDMMSTLRGLGMSIITDTKPWTITVPSHRFDIALDVDLVEEIIRIYGYDKISPQPMIAPVQIGAIHPFEQLSRRIGSILSHRGYHEIISYSFVDPQIQQALYPENHALALLNPLSSELSNMRVGLWPGLIASLVYNSNRQQPLIKIFESGVVFDSTENTLQERQCIAGLISGEWGSMNWSEPTRKLDFYDLKGDLQAIFELLDINTIQFIPAVHPGLHPGQSARICIGDEAIGWIGVLHPRLAVELDLKDDVILYEFTLENIPHRPATHYQKSSKFPSVRRDLSFLINQEVTALQIEQAVRDIVSQDKLKTFDVFDVYAGASIPADKKSIAIALTLQDVSRTLVDEEISTLIDAIIKKLNQDFAITLRD